MSLPAPNSLANVLRKRFECLHALVEQPRDKRKLVDALDVPRSTLDDVVRELEQAGLVEYRDGRWYPTNPGRAACHVHRNYLDQLDSLADASTVLDALDIDNEVSWTFIDGADVHETHPNVPDAVMTILLDHVGTATDVRIVTPSVVAGHGSRFYRRGTAGEDSSVEMILPPDVHEWLRSTYPTVATQALDDPKVRVLRAPIPFSFGLSIFDDERAGVTIFTERGIAGLVINDTHEALAWAEETYERVKRDANPIATGREARQTPTNS